MSCQRAPKCPGVRTYDSVWQNTELTETNLENPWSKGGLFRKVSGNLPPKLKVWVNKIVTYEYVKN